MARMGRKPVPLGRKLVAGIDRSGDGCWEWQGFKRKGPDNYGLIRHRDATLYAHRVAYLLFCGPIPDGMMVCHRCDNPPCCNPAHLFLGSARDNRRDCVAKGRAAGQMATHCPRGHEYTPENTIHKAARGFGLRHCRQCSRESQRRYYHRKKEEACAHS